MIFLFLLERKPFTNKNIQSYEHHDSRNNSRKSSKSSKGKRKRLIASPTKTANFSPYRRFNRNSSSINLEKHNTLDLRRKNISPFKNQSNLSMSPVIKKLPKKKNSQIFSAHGIIHLQSLGNEEKVIYSGFKKSIINENNEKIDMKHIDELTSTRKRENIRDSDSPLKPAFKQTRRIGGKNLRKESKERENEEHQNNIEFVDNKDDDDEEDDNDNDVSNDS